MHNVACISITVPPEVSIDATNLVHIIGEESTKVTCLAIVYSPPMADVTFHMFTCDYTGLGEGDEGERVMEIHEMFAHTVRIFVWYI